MQDAFAGDIGDFSKFGLLRWLCGMTAGDGLPRLRVGINWYLVTDTQAGKSAANSLISCLTNALMHVCCGVVTST